MNPYENRQNIFLIDSTNEPSYLNQDPRFGWGPNQQGFNPWNPGKQPNPWNPGQQPNPWNPGQQPNPWNQGQPWNPYDGQNNQPQPNGSSNQSGGQQKPTTAPPTTVPPKPMSSKSSSGQSLMKVSPQSMFPCKYRWTYIWTTSGNGFWLWIIYFDHTTVSGFTWTGWGPSYMGIDPKNIDVFSC